MQLTWMSVCAAVIFIVVLVVQGIFVPTLLAESIHSATTEEAAYGTYDLPVQKELETAQFLPDCGDEGTVVTYRYEYAPLLQSCEIYAEIRWTDEERYEGEIARLAGKPAQFKVTVKEVKEKQLPELNDEFAGEVSEFETLAEYKEDIKKSLLAKKEADAKGAKEDAVIDAIVENAQMEIPDAMVETQQRQTIDEFGQRLQMQGLNLEQYFQFTGLTYEHMMEQVKPQAERRIKSRLVLEAVAAAENIEATEEDFDAEVKRMAEGYKMEADKIKELMGEQGKKQIMEDLAVRKAVDFVVSEAVEK